MSAQISVARCQPDDAGHRKILLSLDDQPWAALAHGQTATRAIEPGTHAVKADNTLFRKTLDFEAKAGEHVRFTVVNREGPGTWLFMFLGAPLLYLGFAREESKG